MNCVFLRKISCETVKNGGISSLFMYGKKYCADLVKAYYSKGILSFSERETVRRALESADAPLRSEFDTVFRYMFENGSRNVNAAALTFFLSPATVYRRLDKLCDLVFDELSGEKKYTAVTLKYT